MKELSIQALLDWLENNHFLPQRNVAEAYILFQQNQEPVPLYIHVLLGIGAFVGFWSAIGLLSASKLIDWNNSFSLVVCGVISIGLAILIHYSLKNSEALLHSFGLQLTCILMLMGKALFVFGFSNELYQWFPHIPLSWLTTFSIGIIVIPTYFLFPIIFDRFLSSLILMCALIVTSLIESNHNGAFYAVYVALIALVGWLINDKNKHHHLEALTYAGLIALGIYALLLCSSVSPYVLSQTKNWQIPFIIFNLTLAVAIVFQCLLIKMSPPRNYLFFTSGCIGLLILGIITTNGILYSLGLMLLGYEKYRRNLIFLGIIFLGLFLVDYYYSLSLNLAHKAAVLAGSGGLLLLTRMVLLHEHWDKEP